MGTPSDTASQMTVASAHENFEGAPPFRFVGTSLTTVHLAAFLPSRVPLRALGREVVCRIREPQLPSSPAAPLVRREQRELYRGTYLQSVDSSRWCRTFLGGFHLRQNLACE